MCSSDLARGCGLGGRRGSGPLASLSLPRSVARGCGPVGAMRATRQRPARLSVSRFRLCDVVFLYVLSHTDLSLWFAQDYEVDK